jgi:flavodoxin
MTMLDRMLHATRLAGRAELTVNRTAADDLRDLGFPVGDAGAGRGRTAVEDVDEDETDSTIKASDDDADTTDSDDEANTATSTQMRGQADDTEDFEDFGETDEKDPNYKKRFVGSQKQHLEDKKRIDELNARLARLESQPYTPPATETKPALRDETAARLISELDQLDPNDKDVRRKTIEKWVDTNEKQSETVARRVVNDELTRAELQKAGYQKAVESMKASLKAKGMDPDKYFPMADAKAAHLKATNLQWFKDVPVTQQFDAIADLVKADRDSILAEQTKEANMALRKQADGVVGKGNKSVIKPKSSDKDDVPDRSFTQQQRDVQKLRLKEGNRRYAEAGR